MFCSVFVLRPEMIALMFLTVTWLFSEIKGVYDFALNALLTIYKFRGVSGGWAAPLHDICTARIIAPLS